uniref:Uncharacterized protein n=1 Tax=Glossina palpalis gambiensis TaxID=67801 RepID=A0A1B0BWU7_9MUSC
MKTKQRAKPKDCHMRPFENFVFQSLPILVRKATLHSNRSSKNDINFIRDTTKTKMKTTMTATATAAAIQVEKIHTTFKKILLEISEASVINTVSLNMKDSSNLSLNGGGMARGGGGGGGGARIVRMYAHHGPIGISNSPLLDE